MNSKAKVNVKSLLKRAETSTILILLVMIIVMAFLEKNFFTAKTITSYLEGFAPLILLAMGQAIVMISGGLDMSCGTAMALVVCVMTRVMDQNDPSTGVIALVIGLLVAMCTGLVNGVAVAVLRLPPVIATYATSYIWLGIALFVTPTPGGAAVPWFRAFYSMKKVSELKAIGQIIPSALLWILLGCVIWMLVKKSRMGRYLYAVGSHSENAYASGIPAERIQISAYLLNALFIFFVAVFCAAQNGAGNAHLGDTMTLRVVAAAAVGGISLAGGKGNVYMAIAGACIMSLVSKLIFSANIPTEYQTLVSGVIIIIAIAMSAVYSIYQKKAQLKGGKVDE